MARWAPRLPATALRSLRLDRVADALSHGPEHHSRRCRGSADEAELGTFCFPRRLRPPPNEGRQNERPTRSTRALSLGRRRTRFIAPITTRNGACRNLTIALSTKSCAQQLAGGVVLDHHSAQADNFDAPSTASFPRRSLATRRGLARLMRDAGIVRNRPRSRAQFARRAPSSK